MLTLKVRVRAWWVLIGVAVLHAFSSAAWAAYLPPPQEVPIWHGIVWTVIAIVVGLLLYALRYWWLFCYGAVEVVVALFIIYFSIAPASQSIMFCNGTVLWGLGCYFQSLLITLAGIYIFVRGMDNMSVASFVQQCWGGNARRETPAPHSYFTGQTQRQDGHHHSESGE